MAPEIEVDEANDTVRIETTSKRIRNRLDAAGYTPVDAEKARPGFRPRIYDVPAEIVIVRPHRAQRRELTEEEKQVRRDRLAKYRKAPGGRTVGETTAEAPAKPKPKASVK